ncbi:DNA-binding transcriptional regulator, MarR family [Daejeonella rubra]|uniref:DNA-binding transcriptional regulator, MarR family n=1 Tax=Daejeonella rubra TaxID=990371 RepID=A0A1G9UPR6_9SPHI|nr:DNA-binding transcriptional regulator, MarR family [Daejeonella rubra]
MNSNRFLYLCLVKIKETGELAKMVQFMDTLRDIRKVMINHFTRKVKEHNLEVTIEMLEVLYVLWQQDNINQKEIAEKTSRNKASITSLIDNLAARDLVTRTQDPTDRRNNLIALTAEGEAYQEKLIPPLEEMYESIKIDISVKELENTTNILQKVYQKIKG